MSKHVVLFSGGIGSWAAAKRVAAQHGTENLQLLFTDTLMEDEDLYRFLEEGAKDVGGELIRVVEGRTPWEVFNDWKYLGNSRNDPCSKALKRRPTRTWLNKNCDPEDTIVYLGYDWTEIHRQERAEKHWVPWTVRSPMTEAPLLYKSDMLRWLEECGIKRPRLYTLGFPHNNCGGFCIKTGQKNFRHLLEVFPDLYKYHEEEEQKIRKKLNKDVAILRDRTGGKSRPLTLKEFRHRMQKGEECADEWGGCGCFDGDD